MLKFKTVCLETSVTNTRMLHWRTALRMRCDATDRLSKIASAKNKPNQQTIICREFGSELIKSLPVRKVPGLGGKLGTRLSHFVRQQLPPELAPKEDDDVLMSQAYDAIELYDKAHNWSSVGASGTDVPGVKLRTESAVSTDDDNSAKAPSPETLNWIRGLMAGQVWFLLQNQVGDRQC